MTKDEQAAKDYAKECEHFSGDYAASDCEYLTPLHPNEDYDSKLRGDSGFDAVVKEAFLAGVKYARDTYERKAFDAGKRSVAHESCFDTTFEDYKKEADENE